MIVGDAAGTVDTVALKGVHHAITTGRLAAEAIHAALARSSSTFDQYERSLEQSASATELYRVRNARQPLQRGLIRGAPLVNLAIATRGRLPPGRLPWRRDDERPMFVGNTHRRYPKPDGRYTFDKLSSVYLTANATRDDAPNHIRIRRSVPRELAETWRWMCPAGVYELALDAPAEGNVDVIVNPGNCVQCGAITAKGGRLTPPEGGDGPLYRQT